jgi:hypothetical protein
VPESESASSLTGRISPRSNSVSKVADTSRSKLRKPRYRVVLSWNWVSSRVWVIAVLNAEGGWDVRLRTYNFVPAGSEIFEYCRRGDVAGVRKLVADGKASLTDRADSWGGGVTTLMVSRQNETRRKREADAL